MILKQYGVSYHRVKLEDIELIRYWRNQNFIRDTMEYKNYITPKMQLLWFNSINNTLNYYFIIEFKGNKIGLINCKDWDTKTNIAEGGIFIWDKFYWQTSIPALASLTILQASFDVFKIGEGSVAKIACANKAAINFNKTLGYEILEKTCDGNYYKLFLSKERYYSYCKRIIRAANELNKENCELKVIANYDDAQAAEINNYILANNQKL